MALYVNHARHPYRGMRMSHLLADSTEELEEASKRLGLPEGCVQHPGTHKEHLDVSETKRSLAIAMGAHPVTSREIGEMIRRRRQQG